MSKNFKKFMNPYGPGWMCVTIFTSVLMIAAFISMMIRYDIDFVALGIMFVIILISLIRLIRSIKFFKNLKADPACPAVENEFENAISMRKDRIRFGENYIFMKRSGKLLKYSDIKQVYQYIHKTNGAEDARQIKYVDLKGKTHKLCRLELEDKSREELATMISIIYSKNPNVKIGYQK